MAVKAEDVTYSKEAFAAIEVKGRIYFLNVAVAKQVKHELTEQLMFTSSENAISNYLEGVSEFIIDVENKSLVKPSA
jgi:hypothetical protein